MPRKSTSSVAALLALLTSMVVSTHTYAQPVPPVPPRQASGADSGRPCTPDPMKRYEMADRGEPLLFEPSGNPDKDFANRMSAHHQEGVDMAKLEIANGKSRTLKAMARRIVKDQQSEIVELDKWSARHNVRVSRDDRH